MSVSDTFFEDFPEADDFRPDEGYPYEGADEIDEIIADADAFEHSIGEYGPTSL